MTVTFTPLPAGGVQLMSATPGPDLAAAAYREVEYVATGRARRFDETAPSEADFSTRVLIRRPIASGTATLVVEWLNVSSGDDAAPDYTYLADEIVRRGQVWVGVSAQYIGVEGGRALVPTGADPRTAPANGLKGRDPDRYADLRHPGDAFCYGIVTAITEALSDPVPGQPLADLQVQRRIAVGESQSAFALTTYVNTVQPVTTCFDAFLVHSRGSASLPLGEAGCGIDLDQARHQSPVLIRDDLTTPVIVLETETDVLSPRLHYWQARQPDTAMLRVWEVAGTAHADRWQIGEFEEFLGCPDPVNRGQQAYVARAALRWLDTWAAGGPAAPSAPPLDIEQTDPPRFVTDAAGNASGGVRTPCVDVPTQVLAGLAAPGASVICSLFGRTLPLAEAHIRALYRDRGDYLARYAAAVQATIDAGFALPEDADALLVEARPDLVAAD